MFWLRSPRVVSEESLASIGDGLASLARPDDQVRPERSCSYVRIREGGERSQGRRGAPRKPADFCVTTLGTPPGPDHAECSMLRLLLSLLSFAACFGDLAVTSFVVIIFEASVGGGVIGLVKLLR